MAHPGENGSNAALGGATAQPSRTDGDSRRSNRRGSHWIDCVLGDKIPTSAHQGVKVNVKDFLNFNHTHHSGFTVFIAE